MYTIQPAAAKQAMEPIPHQPERKAAVPAENRISSTQTGATEFTIQRCRFGDKLDMELEMENEDLLEARMPKLILQPLAENAIDHGIDVSDNEDPTLWLTIREEDKHIFFEIRDNGAGMTQEKADQILTYQSSGYGVRNVCDRIHVLYGEKGEMKIESTPGKGTRVFIRIPKKTEAKVL